jgi:hypothetical protein
VDGDETTKQFIENEMSKRLQAEIDEIDRLYETI